jgi:hypothetical protein
MTQVPVLFPVNSQLEELLFKRLSSASLSSLTTRYSQVKQAFLGETPFVNATNPYFTDHGIDHILEVQRIIFDIIKIKSVDVKEIELYIIAISSFFHDWGNVISRDEHRDTTHNFYHDVFSRVNIDASEFMAIQAITRAHTGSSISGGSDTLNDVPLNYYLHNNSIRLQLLASILKLADELSENKSRTNISYIRTNYIPTESLYHHFNALFTEIIIDPQSERIAMNYRMGLLKQGDKLLITFPEIKKHFELSDFLSFLVKKIHKANMERRYTQFYMRSFVYFKELSINMNFILMDDDSHFGRKTITIPAILLTDKILLTDESIDKPFDVQSVVTDIQRRF